MRRLAQFVRLASASRVCVRLRLRASRVSVRLRLRASASACVSSLRASASRVCVRLESACVSRLASACVWLSLCVSRLAQFVRLASVCICLRLASRVGRLRASCLASVCVSRLSHVKGSECLRLSASVVLFCVCLSL